MLIKFYWVAKDSKFPPDKRRFDKTDPHCSVALSKRNVALRFSANKREISLLRVNYYSWGVRLRQSVNKRKIQFSFLKVSASAYESVRLRECVNTEFDWVVKRGF